LNSWISKDNQNKERLQMSLPIRTNLCSSQPIKVETKR
jgi:hypothetical protein